MSRAVPALALLVVLGQPAHAAPSAAQPLSVEDVVRLAEGGVGEKALRALADHQGVARPVGPAEVLLLSRAGLSDGLVAAIVEAAHREGPAGPQGSDVRYEEQDGVLRITGRGDPSAPQSPEAPPATGEGGLTAPPPAPRVVGVEAPAVEGPAVHEVPAVANPHPWGAVFGPTGSAISVPARFGDPPSRFGRTVVTLSPYLPLTVLPAPVHGHVGHVGLPAPLVDRPEPRTISIRTSRGPIRVPN